MQAPSAASPSPQAVPDAEGSRQPRKVGIVGFVLLVVIAVPIAAYAALWLYHLLLSWFGVATPALIVPLVALIIALVGPWLLVHYEAPIGRGLAGALRAFWQALARTPLSHALARRFPGLAQRMRRLFSTSPMAGLLLLAVLFAASAVVWFFLVLLAQVVTEGGITGTDTRVINLVATLRTPAADHVFYGITLLGTAETVVVVAGAGALITLLRGRYEDAFLLVLAVAAGSAFFELIKLLVRRPRPPLEDAVYVQGGFSFPSGHSTLSAALYGTLAYLLIRSMHSESAKVAIGVVAALLIFAVGLSRVYLGVHYPSDVLAGWAGGTFWVLLVIAAEDLWPPRPHKPLPHGWRIADVATTIVLLGLGSAYLVYSYQHLPPAPTVTPPQPQVVAPDAVPSAVEADTRRHYTEGLFGAPQEPISLVFIGSRADLEAAFRTAGWTEAEPFGLGSTVQAFAAGLSGQTDPAGPVTPSFVADEPNTLAFNFPLGSTFANRHHIRFWTTTMETSDGRPIWDATASLDEGFELSPNTGFPTHHINPNIDAERAFVVSSLEAVGEVMGQQTIQLVPPEHGHNFAGDPFYTDGRTVIVELT